MYIFGIGTGRCGTQSLSRILSAQKNSDITHELSNKIIKWNYNEEDFDTIVNHIENNNSNIVGSVGFYLINYIDKLIQHYGIKRTKIIIMKRDKELTVQSYLRKTQGYNPWSKKDEMFPWSKAYPKYDFLDKKKCIEKYYDEYYNIANNIHSKYNEISQYFNTVDLSNDQKLTKLFHFLGFKDIILSTNTTNRINFKPLN